MIDTLTSVFKTAFGRNLSDEEVRVVCWAALLTRNATLSIFYIVLLLSGSFQTLWTKVTRSFLVTSSLVMLEKQQWPIDCNAGGKVFIVIILLYG